MSNVIFVDSRVGSKELMNPLKKVGLRPELTTLDSGDFMFEGNGPDGPCNIGVERKTIGDLAQSLQSKRLNKQRTRIHETYEFAWLLIEGSWGKDKTGRLMWSKGISGRRPIPGGLTEDRLIKSVLSLSLRGELHVWQTLSMHQSACFLASLLRWFEKPWEAHTSHMMPYTQETITPLSTFREMVMRIPEIGIAASKAVEDHFEGSLDRVLHSTFEDWANIQTVNPKTKELRRLGEAKALRIMETIRSLR